MNEAKLIRKNALAARKQKLISQQQLILVAQILRREEIERRELAKYPETKGTK